MVERVHQRVLAGMGLLVLHSGPLLQDLQAADGHLVRAGLAQRRTTPSSSGPWRPGHPIAEGVPHPIRIPQQEMYGEYFDIPEPDELVFISSFTGGEVFRSGCTFRRGRGRIFYFSPGDQDFPVYHHPDVQRVLANAVRWAAPEQRSDRAAPGLVNRKVPDLARRPRQPGGGLVSATARSCAPASSASAGPAGSTWTRTRGTPTWTSSPSPGWRTAPAPSSASCTGSTRRASSAATRR